MLLMLLLGDMSWFAEVEEVYFTEEKVTILHCKNTLCLSVKILRIFQNGPKKHYIIVLSILMH